MISLKKIFILLFFTILTLSSCKKDNSQTAEKTIATKDTINNTIKESIKKQETAPPKREAKRASRKKKAVTAPPAAAPTIPPIETALPSWNETAAKKTIIEFIKTVTDKKRTDYIPPENRIAVFDNDGTIWTEYPTYFQVEFVLDRIKELAPENPKWKNDDLIQTAISHDLTRLREKYGVKGLGKLMTIVQSGMTTDQFEQTVNDWIKHAVHPVSGKSYKNMIYQPMFELITLLQNNNFKVFIITSGGVDFARPICSQLFHIPHEHIIGSYQQLEYKKINNKPVLIKSPKILFINEGQNKAVSIYQLIGQKPVIAFGNSDRDLQMLEWCTANKMKNLSVIIHHTDNERESAYDKNASVGRLDKGLEEALANHWLIVDIKKDWGTIFPADQEKNITVNKLK